MAKTNPTEDEEERRARGVKRDRHPPTFRDRPREAIVSVLVLAIVGGLVAFGCTALLVN